MCSKSSASADQSMDILHKRGKKIGDRVHQEEIYRESR